MLNFSNGNRRATTLAFAFCFAAISVSVAARTSEFTISATVDGVKSRYRVLVADKNGGCDQSAISLIRERTPAFAKGWIRANDVIDDGMKKLGKTTSAGLTIRQTYVAVCFPDRKGIELSLSEGKSIVYRLLYLPDGGWKCADPSITNIVVDCPY